MEINLSGRWDVTYQWYKDEFRKTELRLVQNSKDVMGIDEGGGSSYHVEGEVKDNCFEARYLALASTSKEDSSNGEITLEIKNNGNVLEGHYTFYEGNKPIKHKYKAIKVGKL